MVIKNNITKRELFSSTSSYFVITTQPIREGSKFPVSSKLLLNKNNKGTTPLELLKLAIKREVRHNNRKILEDLNTHLEKYVLEGHIHYNTKNNFVERKENQERRNKIKRKM